jgi:DNA-binding transcriptional ArsR family regulator
MEGEPRDGKIVLSDPRAIRALAHPARLAIIEALMAGEELTATECASLTGLSPSATSYHLKVLARWDIVEAGEPREDARDRPWRARGRSIEVSSESPRSTALAETAVLDVFLDRNRALAAEFLAQQASEPAQWRDAPELASGDYWLTTAELKKISRAIRDVLEPYEHRRPGARPDKSRRVRIARLLVPRADSPGDSGHAAVPEVGDRAGAAPGEAVLEDAGPSAARVRGGRSGGRRTARAGQGKLA